MIVQVMRVHSRAFVYILTPLYIKRRITCVLGNAGRVGLRHRGGVKQRTHTRSRRVRHYASNKTRGDEIGIERGSCCRIARACAHGFPGDSTLEGDIDFAYVDHM